MIFNSRYLTIIMKNKRSERMLTIKKHARRELCQLLNGIITKNKKFFKRLKDLRIDNDYLQKDIANILNISQQYYSKDELGSFTIPTEHLITLAKFYNVSIDYIVGLTDEKGTKTRKK